MQRDGSFVHANGIDIYYEEHGDGDPLLLLHGGLMSSGPAWEGFRGSYRSHVTTLARHFRVIAPDTRGSGATVHKDGAASFSVLVADVVGLIDALGLDRPMVCGFSEGGITANVLGITHPAAARAIVNDAGFDYFNPDAPAFASARPIFGGRPDATEADPDAVERNLGQDPVFHDLLERMKADFDDAQGEGYWRTYLQQFFERTVHFPGYMVDDLRAVTAPTLVLAGDRDMFCSVEDAVVTYRSLPNAELAIVADTEHEITPIKIAATIDFLERHAG